MSTQYKGEIQRQHQTETCLRCSTVGDRQALHAVDTLLAHEAAVRLTCSEAAFFDAGSKGSRAFRYAMARGANLDARAAKKKNVKPATRKGYERAAAAADKKVAAAELALASAPSVENQQVLEQARAAASTAHRKLEGAAAPVGGNSSQQRRVDQALPCDLEARADAVCDREAWENAMEIMRERKCGWVHSRIVSGKMVILLAQKFRVEAGVVEVLVHRDTAEAGEAEKDEAEAEGAGVWVAAPGCRPTRVPATCFVSLESGGKGGRKAAFSLFQERADARWWRGGCAHVRPEAQAVR